MKRRAFLSLLGAAGAAPLLPATTQAATAGYSRTLFSRAVMHTRFKPHVSARGLARRFGVAMPQAEAMIAEMARKGIVRPVVGGAGVHVRAVSAVVATQRGAGAAQIARQSRRVWFRGAARNDWLTHLHHICRTHGFVLSDRARAQVAA